MGRTPNPTSPIKNNKIKQDIPKEYLALDDAELSRLKKIGDTMQTVEKGKQQKFKSEEAARNLIETKAVCSIVTDVFSKLKTILYSASNQLPARIAGKEHAEISQIMFEFIDESLERCIRDFDQKITTLKIDYTEEEEEIVE